MQKLTRYAIILILLIGLIFLAGGDPAGADGRLSGLYQSILADSTGIIWNDINGNGLQDPGEEGIPNVVVRLYDKDDNLVATAITDGKGQYRFDAIVPGEYYVKIDVPPGYDLSPSDQGDDALDSDVDSATGATTLTLLDPGSHTSKWDSGLRPNEYTRPKRDPGTVKPPPPHVLRCERGIGSLSGVSTLSVRDLATGYCLAGFLRDHTFALGQIPPGAGQFLADITFLRIFYYGKLVSDLPEEDGRVRVCYAVPPGKQAQIYFLDFYGSQPNGQSSWEPLATTINNNGVACADAQTTGAYALIGH